MFMYVIVHLIILHASLDKKNSKRDTIDIRENWNNNFIILYFISIKYETVEMTEQDESQF